MEKVDLIQLIKDLWDKIQLDKWSYVFKEWDDDFNLYFIEYWNVLLEKWWNIIIWIWEWEIFWEKSFLQNSSKPVSAKIIENWTILYKLNYDKFNILSSWEKEKILVNLALFLSNRVYKLNSVLSFLLLINNNIIDYSLNFDKNKLIEFINNFIDLNWFIILKHQDQQYQMLAWDLNFDTKIEEFIIDMMKNEISSKVWKNYIFIKSWDYIYLFSWNVNVQEYVITNSLLYANSMFRYLGENIERNKEMKILNSIELI